MKKQFLSLGLLVMSAVQPATLLSNNQISVSNSKTSPNQSVNLSLKPPVPVTVHISTQPNEPYRKKFYRTLKNTEQQLHHEIAQRQQENRNNIWQTVKLKTITLVSQLYSKICPKTAQEVETEIA